MVKKQFAILILVILSKPIFGISQGIERRRFDSIILPSSSTFAASFYVSESDDVFVAINGGVFLPKISSWFIPPQKDLFVTSFALNLSDTALFVCGNTEDSTIIYYIKNSSNKIKRFEVSKIERGAYNLIYKNQTCYIWGGTITNSKIGILTAKGIKWVLKIKGYIPQVQVDDSSKIFFALENSIYNLNKKLVLLRSEEKIYGFAFQKDSTVLVSYLNKLGFLKQGRRAFLDIGTSGIIQNTSKNIFVLAQKANKVLKIPID